MGRIVYFVTLGLVVGVALLPRLWLWQLQGNAWMVYPGDQDEYYRGAIHILFGGYYDTGQWLRPPATSVFLATVFSFVGVDIPFAMLVQVAVSSLTVLLFAEMARVLFDSRRAGVAAGLSGAVFLPYASYASQLLSETLFIFFTAAALLALVAARQRSMAWQWLLAAGMLWALATLTRPIGLFAVPLLMLWAFVPRRVSSAATDDAENTPRSTTNAAGVADATGVTDAVPRRCWWRGWHWRGALALLIGFVVVVAPWTARNYAVHQRLIMVDTNGGTSFWLGNLRDPEERELQFVWNDTIPNLADRQQVAVARAIENIEADPLRFALRTRDKIVSLWQFEIRLFIANATIGIIPEETSLPLAFTADVQYIVLMVLGLVGIIAARRRDHNLPLVLWAVYGTLLSAVSLGHPRLRLPLLIAFFVYAALPLAHPRTVWQRFRGDEARWWRLAAGLLLLGGLWYGRVYAPFIESQYWLVRAHLSETNEQAAVFIEQAIRTTPDNYLPYVALGDLRQRQENPVGALGAYQQATALATQNTYVHTLLLDLYRRLEDPAGAERAMVAIDAVGWDNPQMYAWGWQNIPTRSAAALPLGAPAPGLMRGVYAVATDNDAPHRWTVDRAAFRFAVAEPERLLLRLRAPVAALPVTVWLNGELAATLVINDAWQTYRVAVPTSVQTAAVQVVELRSVPTVTSPAEPYPRAVAIEEMRFE